MTIAAPRTVPELFDLSVERFDKPDFMRYKVSGEYVDISAAEFREEVDLAGHALLARGVEAGDRVAIFSENRPGWAFADLAILSVAAWSVPIYTSLMPDEIRYILEDSGAVGCFVSSTELLAKVASIRGRCPALRFIVLLDPAEQTVDPSTVTAHELIAEGKRQREVDPEGVARRKAAIVPDDVASLLYTSGTTGQPKGVMLSHRNFVSNVIDSLQRLDISSTDTHLSFLPLSHSFERTAGYYVMIYAGATIAYAESIDTVPDNLREVRPTVVTSVPRLYEKIYAKVLQGASDAGGLKKQIFFWARRVGIAWAEKKVEGHAIGHGLGMRYALADRLVFSKLRAATGGRIRFFVSGGAPLAPVIAKFFYAAGIPILEGYGLTETSPVITVNTFEHQRFGAVGRPIPNVEVRIEADPDRPDGDGEILVRGPNIMLGYYGLPEKTAAVMTGDGWFRTGDIGFVDDDGFLVITDRKKDLIKTSGGKYVAPQPLENALKLSKFVSQAVVVGDRRKYVSALIVPNPENLRAWAEQQGLTVDDPVALLTHPDVQRIFEREIERINEGRASYETVKVFRLLPDDFTIEAGELTPTLKVKRRVIQERHAALIDTMYEDALLADD